MHGIFTRENREIHESPEADGSLGTRRQGYGRDPAMNDSGKSDRPVVPTKRPNKASDEVRQASRRDSAEAVEGRGLAKGNTNRQNALRAQDREGAPSALDRVRQVARKDRKVRFTTLFHHVTIDRLRQAFQGLNPKASAGADGVTFAQYAMDLEANLQELHSRLQRGAYRARPSRRVYIPKADGRLRPLGIAALEDKVVQRAVVEVLNAVFETAFLGFSHGFRPGRSAHDALDALAVGISRMKVNWVLDADIRGFFDAIDHEWLMKFVEHRIADRRILRLIRKWLSAGVMENGKWTQMQEGTPQGATISPLLANIYLHFVFDLWVQRWRKQPNRGQVIVVRYADDFIVGFESRSGGEQFLRDLRERLAKFSLELHPDKTRLVEFGREAGARRKARGERKPETFDFLGFTHICGETIRTKKFILVRHTSRNRMRRKLKELKGELRQRRHLPIPEQGKWLGQVVGGYFNYFAVPTNSDALDAFLHQTSRHWLRALRSRSQKDRTPWSRIERLSLRWLPKPKILHPYPHDRFDAKRATRRSSTQGRSRVR